MYNKISVNKVGQVVPGFTSVRVDRKSPLGNPFFMHNETMRDEVCDRYIRYFNKEILKKGSPVHTEMVRLYHLGKEGRALSLQCHCSPRRCHGDTIKAFLDKHLA